jgi:hypothetical protein
MYIKYNSSTEIFEIYTFDITVSQSIERKIQTAINFLSKDLDISE